MIIESILVLFGLNAVVLLAIETGYRLGLRRRQPTGEAAKAFGTLEASIFGLMGLLVAFIFYGAAGRFEARRSQIVEEANLIGTAYLRVDLLPAETQPQLREDFRKYLRSRLDVYKQIPDVAAVYDALARSAVLQDKLWKDGVKAVRGTGPAVESLFISQLNGLIDITQVRTVALLTHPPAAVWVLLGFSVIASCLIAGYSMASHRARDAVFIGVFAALLSIAVFIIADYEYPRIGFVRIDPVDQILVDTLERMK